MNIRGATDSAMECDAAEVGHLLAGGRVIQGRHAKRLISKPGDIKYV